MADSVRDEARRELVRQAIMLGGLAVASVLIDPVARRNARLSLERALRSARNTLAGPIAREPAPWEISALHDEARRITREAGPDATTT